MDGTLPPVAPPPRDDNHDDDGVNNDGNGGGGGVNHHHHDDIEGASADAEVKMEALVPLVDAAIAAAAAASTNNNAASLSSAAVATVAVAAAPLPSDGDDHHQQEHHMAAVAAGDQNEESRDTFTSSISIFEEYPIAKGPRPHHRQPQQQQQQRQLQEIHGASPNPAAAAAAATSPQHHHHPYGFDESIAAVEDVVGATTHATTGNPTLDHHIGEHSLLGIGDLGDDSIIDSIPMMIAAAAAVAPSNLPPSRLPGDSRHGDGDSGGGHSAADVMDAPPPGITATFEERVDDDNDDNNNKNNSNNNDNVQVGHHPLPTTTTANTTTANTATTPTAGAAAAAAMMEASAAAAITSPATDTVDTSAATPSFERHTYDNGSTNHNHHHHHDDGQMVDQSGTMTLQDQISSDKGTTTSIANEVAGTGRSLTSSATTTPEVNTTTAYNPPLFSPPPQQQPPQHYLPSQTSIVPPITTTLSTTTNARKKCDDNDMLQGDPIYELKDMDVLSGRGASINCRKGNQKFRALCFAHKAIFEAGNHSVKRRVAAEIVTQMMEKHQTRFLRKSRTMANVPSLVHPNDGSNGDGSTPTVVNQQVPVYYEMTLDQAIVKAQQIMRDYKRPDRMAKEAAAAKQPGKKQRNSRSDKSTPMVDVTIVEVPSGPLVENPSGVHAHDVLSGRGAFANGHVGNETLRVLALERKAKFDEGGVDEKKRLSSEIFQHIRSLDPPGRFLKKVNSGGKTPASEKDNVRIIDSEWEELTDDKAIAKCCQTMRDIARPDRLHREKRKEERKRQKMGYSANPHHSTQSADSRLDAKPMGSDTYTDYHLANSSLSLMDHHITNDASMTLATLAERAAVEAVEGVVDKALLGTNTVSIMHAVASRVAPQPPEERSKGNEV